VHPLGMNLSEELIHLRGESARLKRLLAFALPYVPVGAGAPGVQAELERAVFGEGWRERAGRAYLARHPEEGLVH
jgi:hypothetical protein